MNTKRLGNIGEAGLISELVKREIPVYIPFGDIESADLIAEFNGRLNKIQVKTSENYENGRFTVSLKSSTIRNGKNYYKKYSDLDIDYFSIYNLQSDLLLLLPIVDFLGRTSVTIYFPFKEIHNNQFKPINWSDYTLDRIINLNKK